MGSENQKNTGFDGFISGLSDILDKLNTLSGKLADGSDPVSFSKETGGKDGLKGVFGFSLKVGLGDQAPRVEPFGNIHRDEETGRPVVREVREPIADVFEETGHTLVVIEMPGIGVDDVALDVRDDLLILTAENGEKKYCKEVLLPRVCLKQNISLSCNNGILEIKCNH